MPRIVQLTLDQVNRQIDVIDGLQSQVANLTKLLTSVGHIAVNADPLHAPQTSNNITFTWNGGTQTLSWNLGYIKDKNWSAQTTVRPVVVSSAPGQPHIFPVPAGSLPLNPSTYYWMAWDPDHQKMRATTDASTLHGDEDIHIICQVFTGTAEI